MIILNQVMYVIDDDHRMHADYLSIEWYNDANACGNGLV